jgi:hypothetical protein
MRPPTRAIVSHNATIDIAVPAHILYEMVSDISRMGEWSPEATGGHWAEGATGAVGDWFTGSNQTSERSWERECQVAAANPGRDFTFVTGGLEKSWTWWSYEFDPTSETSTTVTERWWIINKSPAMEAASPEQFAARAAYTLQMIEATLAALKERAEADA